jgi:hypothetical protein
MPQPAGFGGFLYDPTRPSECDMPMVAQTLCELPTLANGLEAESKQNPPDPERPGFYIDGCTTVWTCSFAMGYF